MLNESNEMPRAGSDPPEVTHTKTGSRRLLHCVGNVLLALGFSTFALGLFYLYHAPRIYRAVALLQIGEEQTPGPFDRNARFDEVRDQNYLQTQYKNLKSRTLLENVAFKLKLKEDPRSADQYADVLDVSKKLARQITVAPVRLSRLVEVKVDNATPALAADIANTLVNTFKDDNLDIRTTKAKESLRWLNNELVTLKKQVRDYDEALQQFKEDWKLASLEGTNNIVAQALFQAQADWGKARAEAAAREGIAGEVRKLREQGTNPLDISQIANDVSIRDLLTRSAEREATSQGLLKQKDPASPDVQAMRKELESLKGSIQQRAESIYQSIQNDARVAAAVAKSLQQEVQRRQDEYLELTKLRIKYDELARDAESSQFLYKQALSMGKETEMIAQNQVNNIRIVDAAKTPVEPSSPNTVLVLLVTGLAAVFLGGLGLVRGWTQVQAAARTERPGGDAKEEGLDGCGLIARRDCELHVTQPLEIQARLLNLVCGLVL